MYGQVIPDPLIDRAGEIYKQDSLAAAVDFLDQQGFSIQPGSLYSRLRRRGVRAGGVRGGPVNYSWTIEEIATLNTYFPDANVPPRFLEEKLGRAWESILREAKKRGLRRYVTAASEPRLGVPNLQITRPLVVFADIHVPYQDAQWMGRVLDLGLAWGARETLFAGDAIDASAYTKHERKGLSHTAEARQAKALQLSILKHMEHIWWSLGNHEGHVGRKLDWSVPLHEATESFFVPREAHDQVTVLDSYALTVNGTLRIEHPKLHGKTTAADFCSTYLMDVAIAHLHHSAQDMDRSGKFHGITIGCAADPGRMYYCTRITHGKWQQNQGALIVVPVGERLEYWNLTPDMPLERMQGIYSPSEFDQPAESVA